MDRGAVEPLTSAVQRPQIQSCIATERPKKSLISREIVKRLPQAGPTRPNEDRAVRLPRGRRRAVQRRWGRKIPPQFLRNRLRLSFLPDIA